MNKANILKLVLEELEKNRQVLVAAALEAKEASTSEESKAENKYDTRGLEASYYAGAQAKRAVEIEESLFKLNNIKLKSFESGDKIEVGALVCLIDEEESEKTLFLLPVGGVSVFYNDQSVTTIGVEAPLAKILMGKLLDDEFRFREKQYIVYSIK